MGKITGEIVYGLKSQDKVNKILSLFIVDEYEWDDLNIEMYDSSVQDLNNLLSGHSYKDFYRVDSSIFPDLVKDLKTGKSNYVTYVNGVASEGLIPEKLSVLIKSSTSMSRTRKEVIATKLLNYFGLTTPYNFHINDKNKKAYPYIGSVDMISENERFYSFYDLGIEFFESLPSMFKYLEEYFDEGKSSTNVMNVQVDLEKLKEELLLSYLVRQVLLFDADFGNTNVGFLINEKTNQVRFVNFDFELAFFTRIGAGTAELRRNMKFAMENYPKLYDDFITRVKEIKKVLDEVSIPSNNSKDLMIAEFVKQRLITVLNYHDNVIAKM